MESFKRALVVLLIVVSFPLFAADPLDTWHWRSPTPTGNQLRGVAWGGGRYVAVGFAGTAVFSEDGRNWINSATPTALNLQAIAYGDGIFVAVGALGEILSSTDGRVWKEQSSGTFSDLSAIAFGNGRWVAVGASGTIVVSTNGAAWTVATTGGDDWHDVIWGGGLFLAVGGELGATPGSPARGSAAACTSLDGTSWRRFDPTGGSLYALRAAGFGGGRYLISSTSGILYWSDDLVRWNFVSTDVWQGFARIIYVNGEFLGLAGYESTTYLGPHRSIDGRFWEIQKIEDGRQAFTGGASGPFGTVVVGGLFRNNGPSIIHSTDHSKWTSQLLPGVAESGNGPVRYSGGRFFFHPFWGPGRTGANFWSSSNGISWRFNPGPGTGIFTLPAFGNGRFICVGEDGQCAISADGAKWITLPTGTTVDLSSIEFGNGRFVAVGEKGTIISTTDGTNWQQHASYTDTEFYTVAWNAGTWVASGPVAYNGVTDGFESPPNHPLGAVVISTSGVDWRVVSTNGFRLAVPFKSGFFSDTLRISQDGETWQETRGDIRGISSVLASSGDLLVGASYGFIGASIGLFSSSDGTNWTRRLTPTTAFDTLGSLFTLGGIAFGNGTWIVNHAASLLQSDPIAATAPALAEQPRSVSGYTGQATTIGVRALGTSPLSYQWSRNGQPISGATNQFLALPASEDPTNRFRVTVSNAFGSTNSADVTITAQARPELKLVRQSSNWLEVKGTPGRRYVAQQSGDLGSPTNWTSIGLVEIDGDFPAYLSIDLPADTNRFFRAVAEP